MPESSESQLCDHSLCPVSSLSQLLACGFPLFAPDRQAVEVMMPLESNWLLGTLGHPVLPRPLGTRLCFQLLKKNLPHLHLVVLVLVAPGRCGQIP